MGSKYSLIYADPPWTYRDKANAGKRGAAHKYSVMSMDDIKHLPIWLLAEKDSVCYLWVTAPLIDEGLRTLKMWGFKYKTVAFTWIKTNPKAGTIFKGMGHYTRSNSEYCILGTRGRGLPVLDKSVSQIIMAPRMKHSAKPEQVRDRLRYLHGKQLSLELFARGDESFTGWTRTGLESDGRDILHFIKEEADL